MLLVALAWNPRGGFGGLNVFFARYLFSIGLPVEKWLHFLAELAQLEPRPERFLVEALAALRAPAVGRGGRWRAGESQGEQGERTPRPVEFENSALALTVYSRFRMSPALHWHLHLLGQLLGEFYVAKLREEQLRQPSYLQAVHETGARMTPRHQEPAAVAERAVLASRREERNRDSRELQALVRRQLPRSRSASRRRWRSCSVPRRSGESLSRRRPGGSALARQYRSEGVQFDARPRGAPRRGCRARSSTASRTT